MPDFLGLMKQAAELKSKMEAMQAELDRVEVEGTAGGGLVSMKLPGRAKPKPRISTKRCSSPTSARSSKTLSSPRTPTRAASSKPYCRTRCRR